MARLPITMKGIISTLIGQVMTTSRIHPLVRSFFRDYDYILKDVSLKIKHSQGLLE